MRSITASSGLISCAEMSTAMSCSRVMRREQRHDLVARCAGRGSRAARRAAAGAGRAISAWAIRTRCCSPPESRPTRVSAKRAASTASSISSTSARRAREGRGMPRRCASRPSADEIARAQRQVGVEQELLRDVADQRVARARAARPAEQRRAPRSGACRPRITRNSVVLPAPFEPISPVNSPGAISKLTPSRIWRPAEPHVEALDRRGCSRSPMRPLAHSFSRRDAVRDRPFQRLDLGEHPRLVVIAGGRHRLVHPDHGDPVMLGGLPGSDSVSESVTCWL